MDIQEIINSVKEKFGDSVDVEKVKEMLKGKDLNGIDLNNILAKLKEGNFLGDLDGDGVQENLAEELKGKAKDLLGGIGKMFGK